MASCHPIRLMYASKWIAEVIWTIRRQKSEYEHSYLPGVLVLAPFGVTSRLLGYAGVATTGFLLFAMAPHSGWALGLTLAAGGTAAALLELVIGAENLFARCREADRGVAAEYYAAAEDGGYRDTRYHDADV